MKHCLFICLFIYSILLFSSSCTTRNTERANGWYYISNGTNDSISEKPIVTVDDFEILKLDSSLNRENNKMIYQIIGKINQESVEKWAEATEKSIGKRIGFIYNNELICDPQVNCRIESGNFAISSRQNHNLKEIYTSLQQQMQ